MVTILLVLISIGVILAVFGAILALRAYLGYRRARAAFQAEVTDEVARLALRTGELERGVAELNTRAEQLPIRISELQQSLAALKTLTGALGTSLRQAQRVLSVTQLKTSGVATLADGLGRLSKSAKRGVRPDSR